MRAVARRLKWHYGVEVWIVVTLISILDVELGLHATWRPIPDAPEAIVRITRGSVGSRVGLFLFVSRLTAKAIGIALAPGRSGIVLISGTAPWSWFGLECDRRAG